MAYHGEGVDRPSTVEYYGLIMKTHKVNASEVRLSPLLDRVYVAGDHVEITRRGEVVARLVPAECRWVEGRAHGGTPLSPMGDFCPHCAGKIVEDEEPLVDDVEWATRASAESFRAAWEDDEPWER